MRQILFSFIVLCFDILCLTGKASGQTSESQIHLIPSPQEIKTTLGTFTMSQEKRVSLTNPDDTAMLFAVNQFLREVKADMGFDMSYGETLKKSAILIGYRGWEKKFDKLTTPLLSDLRKCGREGYILKITPEQLLLVANSDTGIFYGIQTLNQLIRANRKNNDIPCLTIIDWPALRYRGWQDDISRGPIPKLAYLKEEIRKMSFFKLNAFTLYTENVFKLVSHPDIASPDGITADEIKELSGYAKKYHVNLIGNFQAFGHFGKILEKPEYAHLAETPNVISPAFPETYKLLGDILKEIASAYDSKLFMINCDEVFGLGSGPAHIMVDTMGLAGVYAYHINKLVEILKPYHKTILMWGDIARDYPEIIPKLPKDIIVLPWAYQSAPSFRDEVEPFKKAGLDFWVCPGVSCWNRIFPDISVAKVNISHFVRDGYAMGAQGMLNTTWDDDGENLFSMNWLPLSWGAACAWKPVVQDKDSAMNRRFDTFINSFDPVYFGASAGVARNMIRLDGLKKYSSAGKLTDRAFWSPMIDNRMQPGHTINLLTDAMSLEKESSGLIRAFQYARGQAVRNKDNVDYLIFAARRAQYMARKNALKYRLNDPEEMKHIREENLQRSLKGLESQLISLRKDYIILWNRENRRWWLDHNLSKYDRMEKDLKGIRQKADDKR